VINGLKIELIDTTRMDKTMYKQAALDALAFNKKTPESLLHTIPHTVHVMKDKDNHEWSFVTRRRCHVYVLARSAAMARYEEIYKKV
jgi:hypothetical protein